MLKNMNFIVTHILYVMPFLERASLMWYVLQFHNYNISIFLPNFISGSQWRRILSYTSYAWTGCPGWIHALPEVFSTRQLWAVLNNKLTFDCLECNMLTCKLVHMKLHIIAVSNIEFLTASRSFFFSWYVYLVRIEIMPHNIIATPSGFCRYSLHLIITLISWFSSNTADAEEAVSTWCKCFKKNNLGKWF